MGRYFELNFEGLQTDQLKLQVPQGLASPETLKSGFAAATAEVPQGPIHSGYRRQILAREGLGSSRLLANRLRESFDSMLVLGIGGSALGAKTALSALQWRVPVSERRRVLIAENLDPIDFEQLWSQIDPAKTCFLVISKSGGTIETIAQFSVVLDRLESSGLDARKHVIAVTDPQKGALRTWVNETGVQSLEIPCDVGGRFSVLTPVGLLPIAFAGIDIEGMVEAAARHFEGLEIPLEQTFRIATRTAALAEAGINGHVLMPYATSLREFGDWFVQLWGESLGKIRSNAMSVGQIPVAALGATDQHSLLQLLVEGPSNLMTGFLRVKEWPVYGTRGVSMQKLPAAFAGLSYAVGHSFGDILNAELTATQRVLKDQGRPVYELALSGLTPECLGALFAFYMDYVTATAVALRINPYDQPGVEYGKKILPSILTGA